MAVKAHVRAFVADLAVQTPWSPVVAGRDLEQAFDDDPEPLIHWADVCSELRVGHGAVAMHRRHPTDLPPLSIKGLQDFEALLLCAACLHHGMRVTEGYHLSPGAAPDVVRDAPQWLFNLLRMEPDFFDELLLEVAARRVRDPAFAQKLASQAEELQRAARDLHGQGERVLGERRTVTGFLRRLVGAGPDLAQGTWARWTRAVVVLGLLDAKGD